LRFALKTHKRLRIVCNVLRQKLQRNKAVQSRILGLINDAHATTTELLDDAVVGNGLADHGAQILRAHNVQVNEYKDGIQR
jgi:hypothetical protein